MAQPLSVLQRATKADVRAEPFPHIVLDGALPENLYRELVAESPRPKALKVDETKNNKRWNYSARQVRRNFFLPRLWRQFIAYHSSEAFFRELIDLFYEQIYAQYPERFPSYEAMTKLRVGIRGTQGFRSMHRFSGKEVWMDAQIAGNTPVREASSVKTSHVDNGAKLFSGLFYMRNDEDDSVGGDLTISRFKPGYSLEEKLRCFGGPTGYTVDEEHLEHIRTVKYSSNVLVVVLNSLNALHGVTVRHPTPHARRFVNLVVEVDPPLYSPLAKVEQPLSRATQDRATIPSPV